MWASCVAWRCITFANDHINKTSPTTFMFAPLMHLLLETLDGIISSLTHPKVLNLHLYRTNLRKITQERHKKPYPKSNFYNHNVLWIKGHHHTAMSSISTFNITSTIVLEFLGFWVLSYDLIQYLIFWPFDYNRVCLPFAKRQ